MNPRFFSSESTIRCTRLVGITLLLSVLSTIAFSLPKNKADELEKLIMKNLFSKALSNIESIESMYPDDSELFLLKGICYYNTPSLKQDAPAILGRALMLCRDKSEKIDIVYHLGKAYAANDDYENAAKCFVRLETMVPEEFAEFRKHIQELLVNCEKEQKKTNIPNVVKDSVVAPPSSGKRDSSMASASIPPIVRKDTVTKKTDAGQASVNVPSPSISSITAGAVVAQSEIVAAKNGNTVAATTVTETTGKKANSDTLGTAQTNNGELVIEQTESTVDITPPLSGMTNNRANIAALPPLSAPTKQRSVTAATASQDAMKYTIQICTMSFPLSDSFFKGQYGIKLVKMGDLYKYIYNMYEDINAAMTDLPEVRKIYPDAFIREYCNNKLGKAIKDKTPH